MGQVVTLETAVTCLLLYAVGATVVGGLVFVNCGLVRDPSAGYLVQDPNERIKAITAGAFWPIVVVACVVLVIVKAPRVLRDGALELAAMYSAWLGPPFQRWRNRRAERRGTLPKAQVRR